MSGQIDLSTKTIKIYGGAFDAAARASILAHLADLNNPHDVDKADVELGNVDNTSDANKPISTATAAALAAKAPLASPTFTGVPAAPTAATNDVSTQIATTANAQAKVNIVAASVAAVQADADQALADAAAAQAGATQAIAAAAAAQADADAAQADADQALIDAVPVPSLVAAARTDRPGEAVRLYGETKTGAPDDVTFIDPTWITNSAAGAVVRVDGTATENDPQTIAPAGVFAMESGRVYEVRYKVQRQTDPADPLNDAVSLGIRWLLNTKAGVASGGTTTVENIALVVADGVQERIVTVAVSGRDGVDYNAPAGTVYFRPFVDLFGGTGVTDIIVIDVVRTTVATMFDVGLRSGVDGADPGFFLHRDLHDDDGFGPGVTGHGYVDQSLFRRTGETAYASFDARVTFSGTTPFDHYVAFQARPGFIQVGDCNGVRLHDTRFEGGAASANLINPTHFFAGGDDGFNGTVSGTQRGLWIGEMTLGATIWGIQVENNDCNFSGLVVTDEGFAQFPNGSLGSSALYFGTGNTTSGLYRAASTAVCVQYEGIEKVRVTAAGLQVWDNTGLDSHIDLKGYRSASGLTYGNAVHTWAAPNNATAVSQTINNRAFAVLPANTGAADSNFIIGTTAAGNGDLDGTSGSIKGSSDIAIVLDSDGTFELNRLDSTAFARISAIGDSFITRDADAIHRFSLTNVNAGVGAGLEYAIANGASANDRMAMRLLGSGFTPSGFFVPDTGVLYTGSAVAGLNIGTLAGPIQIFAGGGTQLAATLTANVRPSFVIGNAALATTATDGFPYIPGGAGPPTGIPTAFAGRVPLYWDSVAKQLYIYDGGWLQPKTPAAAATVTWQ